MKKILIIPSWYPESNNPFLGEFVRNQALLLSGNFDVRIMYGKLTKSESRFRKLITSIKFILFRAIGFVKVENQFISPPLVFGFNYFKGINILESVNFKIKIKSWVMCFDKEVFPIWKPDIIHAHNSNFAGVVAAEISEKYSIPFIITDHHHFNSDLPEYIKHRLLETFENSVMNCFVSDWQYRTYLLSNSKIKGTVTGNPVDFSKFIPKEIKNEVFTVTHLSNGDISKDTDTLFYSLSDFFSRVDNVNDIRIKIAGFSKKKIQDCRIKYGNNKWFSKIEFLSSIDKDAVVELLQNSSVYLHTSIFESFGLSCLEAMLCGTPVVSTDNGGINEYLVNGVNGILCKIKDHEAIGTAISDIYNGKIKFDREIVRNSIDKKFDNASFIGIMSDIYNKCI